jgi:hypothetical protein
MMESKILEKGRDLEISLARLRQVKPWKTSRIPRRVDLSETAEKGIGRRQRTGPEVAVGKEDTDDTGTDPGVERDEGTGQEVEIDIGTDEDARIVKRGGLEVAVARGKTGDIEAEVRTGIEEEQTMG